MATPTDKIIIGSEDCSISKVTSLLASSPVFHLFDEKWSSIANELGTPRTLVKRLRRMYPDQINLTDILCDLVDDWVAENGKNATLHEFVMVLERNGLNSCAELLVEGINVNKRRKLNNEGQGNASRNFKKYCRIPQGLQQFIGGNSRFCIVHSLDCQITCEKVRENTPSCHFHDCWDDFCNLTSLHSDPHATRFELDIVKECTLKNLKWLSKLCKAAKGVSKVVFVTSEEEGKVKYVSESLNLELIADTMSWDDLIPAYQMKITDKLEETYGIDFEGEVTDGQLDADLINGKTLKLFKDTLPKELNYYIQRRLLSRHIISVKVFELNSPDIFLFTGMTRYELSGLARDKMTEVSGSQIRPGQISIKYLILEQPYHFDRICDKTQQPVHLLHYENGSLRWVRSRGRMTAIQECVTDNNSQKKSTEDEFCLNLSTEAMCISDSPGMGKSVLLGRIGRELEKRYPDRIVLFIVLREFIVHIKNTGIKDIPVAIESALKTTVCEHVIGEAVLKSRLHSHSEKGIPIELLLDGFDEMQASDSKLPYEILQAIRSSFRSVRMWVTSRPHFLHELENNLAVLGFNIQPFSEDDQIQFLTSFWTSQDSLNVERIRQFSSHCLNSLKTKMNQNDKDIAGIPLQCLLIGEVYKEDAVGYAGGECESPVESNPDFASIADLYYRLVEKKIESYMSLYGIENFDKQAIMNIHARLSMELIFPKQFSKLKSLFPPIPTTEVVKVGIVESSSGTVESYRFVHRTFAEFFVAWFVTDRLRSGKGWEEELTRLFIEHILKVTWSGPLHIRYYEGWHDHDTEVADYDNYDDYEDDYDHYDDHRNDYEDHAEDNDYDNYDDHRNYYDDHAEDDDYYNYDDHRNDYDDHAEDDDYYNYDDHRNDFDDHAEDDDYDNYDDHRNDFDDHAEDDDYDNYDDHWNDYDDHAEDDDYDNYDDHRNDYDDHVEDDDYDNYGDHRDDYDDHAEDDDYDNYDDHRIDYDDDAEVGDYDHDHGNYSYNYDFYGGDEYKFLRSVITYFVDSLTAKNFSHIDGFRFSAHVVQHITSKSENDPERFRKIAKACACVNLVHMFTVLDQIQAFDSHAEVIFNPDLVIYTMEHSCLQCLLSKPR